MSKLSNKKTIEYDLTLISLIGKEIKILKSNNLKQIGIIGIIISETANFLHIKTKESDIKKLLKSDLIIKLDYDSQTIELNCNSLQNTLISRIKKFK